MSKEILFEERSDFRKWLEQTDLNSEGVWLIFSKTKSIKSITANEALEEALCFGWIDGLIKSIDDQKYKKYFAPRRKGSNWSAKNKGIISKLIENNRIKENGLLVIDRSKKDGSWDSNDDNNISEEKFQIFESIIANNQDATANYLNLSKSIKKQFVGLYFEPKNEVTRNKRLLELIDLLERNIKPMEKYSKKFQTQKLVGIILFLLFFLAGYGIDTLAQDSRAKIKDYIDKEIRIVDNFSGQSITLIKEKKEYFIIRKYFGSGVPIIGTAKYKVEFNSDYQIAFSKLVDNSSANDEMIKNEEFILSVGESGLNLYLNRLKVIIVDK